MTRRNWGFVVALVILAIGTSYRSLSSQSPSNATLQGDPSHPSSTQGWVDTRLYFGLGPAGVPDKGVSENAWRDFLDKEVTPRFPAGLSVVDVYGQWQGKKEPSRRASAPRCWSSIIPIQKPTAPASTPSAPPGNNALTTNPCSKLRNLPMFPFNLARLIQKDGFA